MGNDKPQPKVGVGVMVFKDGKILLGKRKGSHGEGEYAFPGGHLEHMESFEDCAKRETLEETGVSVKNVRFQFLYNMKKYAPKHYVHIGLAADWEEGDPVVKEPEKCEGWAWYGLDELPEPQFDAGRKAIEAYEENKTYFDN